MSDLKEWAQVAQEFLREKVLNAPKGNFFQSRITRTPGMITNVPGASATYQGDAIPSDVVNSSSLEKSLRELLAKEWKDSPKGFIRINPGQPSKIMHHEEFHDVFEKAKLEDNVPELDKLTALGYKEYIKRHEGYMGIWNNPAQILNEALAHQIVDGDDMKYLEKFPEEKLKNKLAVLLMKKGFSKQAEQVRRLGK
jgi:hypothetical protein